MGKQQRHITWSCLRDSDVPKSFILNPENPSQDLGLERSRSRSTIALAILEQGIAQCTRSVFPVSFFDQLLSTLQCNDFLNLMSCSLSSVVGAILLCVSQNIAHGKLCH